jgi:hypothetical protein
LKIAADIIVGAVSLYVLIIFILRLLYESGIPFQKIRDKHSRTAAFIFSKRAVEDKVKTDRRELLLISTGAFIFRILMLFVFYVICAILQHGDEFRLSYDVFMNSLNIWDAPHYIDIAAKGYSGNAENGQYLFLVFFPLYPALIRAFGIFFTDLRMAGLSVSVLAFCIGSAAFYKLVGEEYGKKTGIMSLILISVFPFGFFFGTLMTESLFFMLVSFDLILIKKHKFLGAGLVGILAVLCRIQGILLLFAAIVESLIWYRPFEKKKDRAANVKKCLTAILCSCTMISGWLLYLYENYRVAGDPFIFMKYQKEHWYNSPKFYISNINDILDYCTNSSVPMVNKFGMWGPDIACLAAAVFIMLWAASREDLAYLSFFLTYTMLVYSAGFLISGGRYMACAVTGFIFAGHYFKKHEKLFYLISALSAVLMGLYMVGYILGKNVM